MSPVWRRRFSRRIIEVNLGGHHFRFFVGTPQAASWYDPPKAHTLAEYEWVAENVTLGGEQVIDAGAHHGHYSLFLATGSPRPETIHSVEPLPPNCTLIEINAALNGVALEIVEAAVATHKGHAKFIPRSNGRLSPGPGIEVATLRLADINPRATVVKLDIEGAEFQVLPTGIDSLPHARAWMVEVHPNYGDRMKLMQAFLARGFRAFYLDRARAVVRAYDQRPLPDSASSLFFLQ